MTLTSVKHFILVESSYTSQGDTRQQSDNWEQPHVSQEIFPLSTNAFLFISFTLKRENQFLHFHFIKESCLELRFAFSLQNSSKTPSASFKLRSVRTNNRLQG